MNENTITQEFSQFLGWEAISRDSIDVKAIYIDMADGDHAAGIFLSQLVYWYLIPAKDGRSKLRVHRNGEWWVARGRDEWHDEIRLGPRQFDRVAAKLKRSGLIETATYKFAGTPKTHVRLIVEKFMEVWKKFANVNLSELPDAVKSTSPNGEVHIQRLLEEKEKIYVVSDDEAVPPPCDEPTCDEIPPSEEVKTTRVPCSGCGRGDKYAKKLPADIDPKERCAWCFILDGWTHLMDGKKPIPKRTGTSASESLRKKACTRMTEEVFRSVWVFAIERASRTKHLMVEPWFTLEFLLRNDGHVTKIAGGQYDSFNRQYHRASHDHLLSWLAHKQAGLAGEPQAAGFSQIGGK